MASEEGVDHQEAHFRPALLLRGIPADLDPASEGRAVLTAKAGAGFLLNAYRQNFGAPAGARTIYFQFRNLFHQFRTIPPAPERETFSVKVPHGRIRRDSTH